MPDVRDDSTVEALAGMFCSNGRKREEAMWAVGYSKAYARSYCGQMWANPRLKAAIARLDAKQGAKQARTVENLDEMYQEAYNTSKGLNQPSAMVSAVTGIARLYGMDKDNEIGGKTPEPISDEQAERYSAMAAAATRERLQGPKLAKEA